MLLVLSYKDHSIVLVIKVILGTEHTVKVGNLLTTINSDRTLLAFPLDGI